MTTEKLVTLKETLGKEELDAIADVKSRIADSYEKLDSLYGAIEEFEKLPFSHSKPHQTPLEGFDRHKLRGYSKPSIEKTKDLIGKTAIPPAGRGYDGTATSTGTAYWARHGLNAIDALKNRVKSVELAFDSVQGTLDAEYSPPTGWEKIFGSKERKKLGLKYADELKKIQRTHRDGLQKKLYNLEKLLDNLKDEVENDFYSQEPNLEAHETVGKTISDIENNFLKARHEIVRVVGGRQKEGNWDDGNLAWARYVFGDKTAVFIG